MGSTDYEVGVRRRSKIIHNSGHGGTPEKRESCGTGGRGKGSGALFYTKLRDVIQGREE